MSIIGSEMKRLRQHSADQQKAVEASAPRAQALSGNTGSTGGAAGNGGILSRTLKRKKSGSASGGLSWGDYQKYEQDYNTWKTTGRHGDDFGSWATDSGLNAWKSIRGRAKNGTQAALVGDRYYAMDKDTYGRYDQEFSYWKKHGKHTKDFDSWADQEQLDTWRTIRNYNNGVKRGQNPSMELQSTINGLDPEVLAQLQETYRSTWKYGSTEEDAVRKAQGRPPKSKDKFYKGGTEFDQWLYGQGLPSTQGDYFAQMYQAVAAEVEARRRAAQAEQAQAPAQPEAAPSAQAPEDLTNARDILTEILGKRLPKDRREAEPEEAEAEAARGTDPGIVRTDPEGMPERDPGIVRRTLPDREPTTTIQDALLPDREPTTIQDALDRWAEAERADGADTRTPEERIREAREAWAEAERTPSAPAKVDLYDAVMGDQDEGEAPAEEPAAPADPKNINGAGAWGDLLSGPDTPAGPVRLRGGAPRVRRENAGPVRLARPDYTEDDSAEQTELITFLEGQRDAGMSREDVEAFDTDGMFGKDLLDEVFGKEPEAPKGVDDPYAERPWSVDDETWTTLVDQAIGERDEGYDRQWVEDSGQWDDPTSQAVLDAVFGPKTAEQVDAEREAAEARQAAIAEQKEADRAEAWDRFWNGRGTDMDPNELALRNELLYAQYSDTDPSTYATAEELAGRDLVGTESRAADFLFGADALTAAQLDQRIGYLDKAVAQLEDSTPWTASERDAGKLSLGTAGRTMADYEAQRAKLVAMAMKQRVHEQETASSDLYKACSQNGDWQEKSAPIGMRELDGLDRAERQIVEVFLLDPDNESVLTGIDPEADPSLTEGYANLFASVTGADNSGRDSVIRKWITDLATGGVEGRFANVVYALREERQVFAYLARSEGMDSAMAYLDRMLPVFNQRSTQAIADVAAYCSEHYPVLTTLGNATVMQPINAVKGIEAAVGQGLYSVTGGALGQELVPNDPRLEATAFKQMAQADIRKQIVESSGSEMLGMAYDLGVSIVENAARAALFGGMPGGAVMSATTMYGQVFASTVYDYMNNKGADANTAMWAGFLNAGAEALGELVDFGTLMSLKDAVKAGKTTPRLIALYLTKNIATEAGSEGITAFLEKAIDLTLMGDESEIAQIWNETFEKTGSKGKAFGAVMGNVLTDVGIEAAFGGVSGLLLSGGNVVLNRMTYGSGAGTATMLASLTEGTDVSAESAIKGNRIAQELRKNGPNMSADERMAMIAQIKKMDGLTEAQKDHFIKMIDSFGALPASMTSEETKGAISDVKAAAADASMTRAEVDAKAKSRNARKQGQLQTKLDKVQAAAREMEAATDPRAKTAAAEKVQDEAEAYQSAYDQAEAEEQAAREEDALTVERAQAGVQQKLSALEGRTDAEAAHFDGQMGTQEETAAAEAPAAETPAAEAPQAEAQNGQAQEETNGTETGDAVLPAESDAGVDQAESGEIPGQPGYGQEQAGESGGDQAAALAEEGSPAGEQRVTGQAPFTADQQDDINAVTADLNQKGRPVAADAIRPAAEVSDTLREAAKDVADTMGARETVFFESDDPNVPDGFTRNGKIYVKVNGETVATLAHENAHNMPRVMNAVMGLFENGRVRNEVLDAAMAARQANDAMAMDREGAKEEFAADAVAAVVAHATDGNGKWIAALMNEYGLTEDEFGFVQDAILEALGYDPEVEESQDSFVNDQAGALRPGEIRYSDRGRGPQPVSTLDEQIPIYDVTPNGRNAENEADTAAAADQADAAPAEDFGEPIPSEPVADDEIPGVPGMDEIIGMENDADRAEPAPMTDAELEAEQAALDAEDRNRAMADDRVQQAINRAQRRNQQVQTAQRLYRRGMSALDYFSECRRTGATYDHEIARQLNGMRLRNGFDVGGRINTPAFDTILHRSEGYRPQKALPTSLSSPVRVFENVAGTYSSKNSNEENARIYRDRQQLKDTYYEYGNRMMSDRTTYVANAQAKINEAYTSHGDVNGFDSAAVQLLGEGVCTEDQIANAVADRKFMVVEGLDGTFVFRMSGHGKNKAAQLWAFSDSHSTYVYPVTGPFGQRSKNPTAIDGALTISNEGGHTRVFDANGTVYADISDRNAYGLNMDAITATAGALREYYDGAIEQINDTRVQNGYAPIGKIQNYFPHIGRQETGMAGFLQFLQDKDLPASINGLTANFKPGQAWAAFLQQRLGDRTEYDAIRGFNGYVEGAADQIYKTPVIQRLRQLENGLRRHAGRSDKTNSTFVAWLGEYANQFANKKAAFDREAESIFGRGVYQVSQKWASLFSGSSVAANIGSGLSNMVSWMTGAAHMTPAKSLEAAGRQIIQGLSTGYDEEKGYDGFIHKIPYLNRAFGEGDAIRVFGESKASTVGGKLLYGFFGMVDRFAKESMGRAYYDKCMSQGMSEEQAIAKTDDFLIKNFAERGTGQAAKIFGVKWLKPFSQFQLEVLNQVYHFRDIDAEAFEGRLEKLMGELGETDPTAIDWDSVGKKLYAGRLPGLGAGGEEIGKKMAYLLLLSLWGTFTRATLGRDQSWNVAGTATDIGRAIGNIPEGERGFGTVAKAVGQGLLGAAEDNLPFSSLFTDGGRVPMLGSVTTLVNAGQAALSGNGYATPEDRAVAIAKAPLAFVPGGGQVSKMMRGGLALSRGGQFNSSGKKLQYPTPATPGNIARGVLFGPSALQPQGFDYQHDPLTENKTKTWRGLVADGTDPQQAFDVISGRKPVEEYTDSDYDIAGGLLADKRSDQYTALKGTGLDSASAYGIASGYNGKSNATKFGSIAASLSPDTTDEEFDIITEMMGMSAKSYDPKKNGPWQEFVAGAIEGRLGEIDPESEEAAKLNAYFEALGL